MYSKPIPGPTKATTMKKILIVEDHIDIRKLLKMTLEFDDFEIHEAATGDADWVLACELQPDIVLLDVMMPGTLNGLDVCRRIKSDPGMRCLLYTSDAACRRLLTCRSRWSPYH